MNHNNHFLCNNLLLCKLRTAGLIEYNDHNHRDGWELSDSPILYPGSQCEPIL